MVATLLSLLLLADAGAPAPAVRKPKVSWTLQVGLAHSPDDTDHYVLSGIQARFPLLALDRERKSDRLGGLGLEIGAYPYPMIGRAYVPGRDADPLTPGKFDFWELGGVSYYTPRVGPFQAEAGLRLAFVDPAERVLTSPNGCGLGNRTDPRCNAYIKESFKTIDSILFPSFRGERGLVRFAAVVAMLGPVGLRVEHAALSGRVDAGGLRYGITVR